MKFTICLSPGPKPHTWIAVMEQNNSTGRNIFPAGKDKFYTREAAMSDAQRRLEAKFKDIPIEIVWREDK